MTINKCSITLINRKYNKQTTIIKRNNSEKYLNKKQMITLIIRKHKYRIKIKKK